MHQVVGGDGTGDNDLHYPASLGRTRPRSVTRTNDPNPPRRPWNPMVSERIPIARPYDPQPQPASMRPDNSVGGSSYCREMTRSNTIFHPLVELAGLWTPELAERYLPIDGSLPARYEAENGHLAMATRGDSATSWA